MAKRYSILISTFIFILFLPVISHAQAFNSGLRYYKQRNYNRAIATFTQINTPESKLFAAKSYYALGQFNQAENILNELLQNAPQSIYYEAAYTSAIVDFQQKQYGNALIKLYTVFTDSQIRSLAGDAEDFYNQLVNYLTGEQRLHVLKTVKSEQIKYDLVETALGKVSFSSLKQIINQFYESVDEREWSQKVRGIESSLSNKPAYKIEYGNNLNTFTPPDGTVYNIGIVLPKPGTEKPTYSVIQGLYLGARLAANRFNERHSDARVYLTFLPTDSKNLDDIAGSFVQKQYGDLIIGPLFSEQAEQMVSLSAKYNIPVVAPLATSNLRSRNSLFFQANSNFSVHGKTMAAFSVNELGYDTFAVIAGEGTNAEESAAAFRKKAETLGANVVSFQIKDFKNSEFDISPYIKKIGSGLEKVDAVYAPFISHYTAYLVEQLIYTTNTFENPVTLLGSPKWDTIDFSSDIYARSNIFYSVNSFRDESLNDFQYNYRRTFNITPNKYAVIGYDVASYILQLIDKVGNPARLSEAMLNAPAYYGLIKNIYFDGGHVNRAVQVLKVINGNPVPQQWQMR